MLTIITTEEPAQFISVAIGQYTLNHQIGVLFRVNALKIIFLKVRYQTAWQWLIS